MLTLKIIKCKKTEINHILHENFLKVHIIFLNVYIYKIYVFEEKYLIL